MQPGRGRCNQVDGLKIDLPIGRMQPGRLGLKIDLPIGRICNQVDLDLR